MPGCGLTHAGLCKALKQQENWPPWPTSESIRRGRWRPRRSRRDRLSAHWRIPGTECENGRSRAHSVHMSIFAIILAILAVSQAYWAWRGYRLATRLIRNGGRRFLVCVAAAAVYAAAFWWNYPFFGRGPSPVSLTLKDALVTAPFLWWLASSLVAFLVVGLFAIPQGIVGAARWMAA